MAAENKNLDREALAHLEVGRTSVSRPVAVAVTVCFLVLLCAVPVVQGFLDAAAARRGGRHSPWPRHLAILKPMGEHLPAVFSPRVSWPARAAANRALMAGMKDYEDDLERTSFLTRAFLGPVQAWLSGWPGVGNEKAYVGRDGWLFYRPDMDAVTGRGFLTPEALARRARSGKDGATPPAPSPLPAILDFRDNLQRRGIGLVLVVAPNKPSVEARRFNPAATGVPRNPSTAAFLGELGRAGIPVVDGTAVCARMPGPAFLQTDTHWTPDAMERVAEETARALSPFSLPPPARPGAWTSVVTRVTGEGDIAVMLKLPEGQRRFPPQAVEVRRVLKTPAGFWEPDPRADILLLGDSFTNIYSMPGMGWGSGAGFAEHLGLRLGRPLDRIARNDAGAFATREMLSRELASGNDRLAGKKVVVWEFAERELAFGDWKVLPMALGAPASAEGDFYEGPAPGETLPVRARIAQAGAVPAELTVAYADHVRALHLVDLRDARTGKIIAERAHAFVLSMSAHRHTAAAGWGAGDEILVTLRPWEEVESVFGRMNRSELAGDAFTFAPILWAEPGSEPAVPSSGHPAGPAAYALVMLVLAALAVRNARRLGNPPPPTPSV